MKRVGFLLVFLLTLSLYPSGINSIVECTCNRIEAFLLKQEISPKLAILAFSNRSSREETFIENLFELLRAGLEDYLVEREQILGFDRKGAYFSPPSSYDFGLRFTYRELAGEMVLTTRIYDRKGHLKAFFVCHAPADTLAVRELSMEGEGTPPASVWEAELPGKPLAVGVLEETKYVVLYPSKVVIFKKEGSVMRKLTERDIDWPEPVYPSLDERGKVFILQVDGKKHIVVQSSVSNYAMMLNPSDLTLEDNLSWMPVQITEEGKVLLVRFEPGRNYFKGQAVLVDVAQLFSLSEVQPMELPVFYDICAISQQLHLVDERGRHRVFLKDRELPSPQESIGDEIECDSDTIIHSAFGKKEKILYRDLFDPSHKGALPLEGYVIDMIKTPSGLLLLCRKEGRYYLREIRIK